MSSSRSCIERSNITQRPRPARLASYIAVSASRSTDSTVALETSLVTMPIEAVDCTARPASW